jgi:hypothetical protein
MRYRHVVCATVAVFGALWIGMPRPRAAGQELPARRYAGTISGTVVDPAGKPAGGTDVWLVAGDPKAIGKIKLRLTTQPDRARTQAPKFAVSHAADAMTQQDGTFRFQDVPPGKYSISTEIDPSLPYYVEASDTIEVRPGAPVTGITISLERAIAVRGKVVDKATGAAVKGVHLAVQWNVERGYTRFELASCKSDDGGRFEIGGLWPQEKYYVTISPEGYEKRDLPELEGRSGETRDLAKIVLTGGRAAVDGIVVDSAGKPLSGVRVFNSGDAPQPLESKTDAAGRFRLEGFHPGPVYVFAEKEGSRFTGVRTTAGAADVTIKMLRSDEALPPRPPRPAAPSFAEEQKMARTLVERLWATGDHKEMGVAIAAMSRLDRERALKWSAELGGTADGTVRTLAAVAIADTDPEEALSLLAQEGERGFFELMRLAEKYAASDPARGSRFVAEAVIQARKMNQPMRAACLARAGGLAAQLGNRESGRKLVEEAAGMIAGIPQPAAQAFARAAVVQGMAAYDPNQALRFLETSGGQSDRARAGPEDDRARANIAVALCLDDLKTAMAMVQGPPRSVYTRFIKLRIAYRLAPSRPGDAMRVVESIEERESPYGPMKAQAYGWLATAVAPRDKALACSLVDRGLALALAKRSEDRLSVATDTNGLQAALLAVLAGQIGYPDMESVTHRVLAARPTSRPETSAAAVAHRSVGMASILALADPEAARHILQGIEARGGASGFGDLGTSKERWFKAWILADPRHALELADQELAAAKGKPSGAIARSGLPEMADVLTIPPPERLKYLVRNIGLWSPGEER